MSASDDRSAHIDWHDIAPRPCPVASALDLFGDRWSILIIRDVMNGVHRFDDLVARLGISRATLADRLRRLTSNGILFDADYEDARGRVRTEYRLSERGWDLQFVLIALREWGDKHLLGMGNEPLRLVDRSTGNDVHIELVDDETGKIVPRRMLRHAPGPAFDQVHTGRRA